MQSNGNKNCCIATRTVKINSKWYHESKWDKTSQNMKVVIVQKMLLKLIIRNYK